MRTPALVITIVLLHILAVSAFIFIQGCETRRPSAEPPPPPVMPPKAAPAPAVGAIRPVEVPAFQPPGPVETALDVPQFEAGQTYAIQKGDTLSGVASRYGVSSRELADLNGIKDANKIRVGQKLILPAHSKGGAVKPPQSAQPAAAPVSPAARSAVIGGGTDYVVMAGDSLSRIAARHGTTLKSLREANKIEGDKILVGQKLKIPAGEARLAPAPSPMAMFPEIAPPSAPVEVASSRVVPAPAPVPPPAAPMAAPAVMPPPPAPEEPTVAPERAFEYTVSQGDTLDSIARDFVVLKEDIMKANRIGDPAAVKPGQRLIIPMP